MKMRRKDMKRERKKEEESEKWNRERERKNVYKKCRNKKVRTYIALILSLFGLNALHYYIIHIYTTFCLNCNLWTVNKNSIGAPKMWNNQNAKFSNIANFLIGLKQLCHIFGAQIMFSVTVTKAKKTSIE